MIRDSWKRIDAWLQANFPDGRSWLQRPVPNASLAQLERELGVQLPSELRQWLQIHNGPDPNQRSLLGRWALLSTRTCLHEWRNMQSVMADLADEDLEVQVQGNARPEWWHPAWIPIASDGCGDLLCADADPPRGGAVGQIVEFRHDDALRTVIASSLSAWFDTIADDLESGRYYVHDVLHKLVHEDVDLEVW